MGVFHRLVIATAMLCASSAAIADSDSICADRPGKANATCTAPAGHYQVETGLADWTLDRSSGERDTLLILGATAIKFGISDRAHLELDITAWERATSRVGGVRGGSSGFGDILVRYKQQLTAPGSAFQLSFYPFVKLPTANHSLGNGKVEGGIDLPIGYAVPNSPLSISLMPELDWLADSDGRGHHAAVSQAASVGWQVNSRVNLSAELWGFWNWDPAGTVRQYSADGAVAYLVNNGLQLDAGANFGLNRATPDVELYAGVSARF